MIIRPETAGDFDAIDSLVASAARPNEARLVELLRASDGYVPDLALVAEEDRDVVGHIMFSYVTLKSREEFRVLELAPMAVLPERQRQGIGGALIEAGLQRADAKGEPLVVLLGHPTYYPRFGFEPASRHGIEPPSALASSALPAAKIALVLLLTLTCVVTLGALLGAMLPFAFKSMGLDPAICSGPFITTFVDVSGILIYFMIASLILF